MRISTCLTSTFITLLAASQAAFAAGPTTSPVHTPFVTVLLRDFDSWDSNHDGTLSLDEINRVVIDPSVKGDDAAAAAAIKLLFRRKTIHLPPLTKSYFDDYDQKAMEVIKHRPAGAVQPADAISATMDTVGAGASTQPAEKDARIPADFDLYFAAGKQRIARGGADPFPGRFILDHTRQGPLGDCFLVAAANSIAFHEPDRLARLIVPAKNGSYEVRIPATQTITVPALTDAELAISSTTAGDGVWMAIIEQAYGKYESASQGHGTDVEGTELVRTGGMAMEAVEVLTGEKCVRIRLGRTAEARKADAGKVLPKLRQQLVQAFDNHRAVTAGTGSRTLAPLAAGPSNRESQTGIQLPPNITGGHAYAVLSYDPTTDVIEMWNPHGQSFQPKGPPGLANGYPTEHGRFKLPLTEAYQFFEAFGFEQPDSTPAS
jgi:hypothetical protein